MIVSAINVVTRQNIVPSSIVSRVKIQDVINIVNNISVQERISTLGYSRKIIANDLTTIVKENIFSKSDIHILESVVNIINNSTFCLKKLILGSHEITVKNLVNIIRNNMKSIHNPIPVNSKALKKEDPQQSLEIYRPIGGINRNIAPIARNVMEDDISLITKSEIDESYDSIEDVIFPEFEQDANYQEQRIVFYKDPNDDFSKSIENSEIDDEASESSDNNSIYEEAYEDLNDLPNYQEQGIVLYNQPNHCNEFLDSIKSKIES